MSELLATQRFAQPGQKTAIRPQAPPGGQSSISFGNSDEIDAQRQNKNYARQQAVKANQGSGAPWQGNNATSQNEYVTASSAQGAQYEQNSYDAQSAREATKAEARRQQQGTWNPDQNQGQQDHQQYQSRNQTNQLTQQNYQDRDNATNDASNVRKHMQAKAAQSTVPWGTGNESQDNSRNQPQQRQQRGQQQPIEAEFKAGPQGRIDRAREARRVAAAEAGISQNEFKRSEESRTRG